MATVIKQSCFKNTRFFVFTKQTGSCYVYFTTIKKVKLVPE